MRKVVDDSSSYKSECRKNLKLKMFFHYLFYSSKNGKFNFTFKVRVYMNF